MPIVDDPAYIEALAAATATPTRKTMMALRDLLSASPDREEADRLWSAALDAYQASAKHLYRTRLTERPLRRKGALVDP